MSIANIFNGCLSVNHCCINAFVTKSSAHTSNTAVKYIAICADYIGDDSIITINEPID